MGGEGATEAGGVGAAQRDGAGKLDARGGFGAGRGCVRGVVRRCREVNARGGFSEGWDAPQPGRATAVACGDGFLMMSVELGGI